MKVLSWLCSIALLGAGCLLGQEVPPAFEREDSGEGKAAGKEMLDPFDPAVDAPKMVRVQMEFIEMAHKDLTRLMMQERSDKADATALRMKLQEMVDGQKASVLDTQIVMARSGQKATVESISEFMYPTEYKPPALPKSQEGEVKGTDFPAISEHPTAFETKNLGSSLEIEPTIGENDEIIDLRFLPELTWHTGETVWQERKDGHGNITKVSMPDFYKLSINTSLTCISGQYVMVGVASPKNGAGKIDLERKVMILVKCDVLSVIP
ncbi:hypothetical protein HZ994_00935 [Akkermansiaceae bacterium]|nr:hypothetical protein HZ994_00935 [Akkermansiaceae bacterium]